MENVEKIQQRFLSITKRDILMALLLGVIIPVVGILYEVLDTWFKSNEPFHINWKELLRAAFYGFTGHISRKFFEGTKTVIVLKPPKDDEVTVG